MNAHDEQTARIKETWALSMDLLGEMTFDEFEDIFEDRDPFEFL